MEKIKRTLGFILTSPLSRKHPFRSLFRFLIWQIQSNISPSKFFIKKFVGPVKFYSKKGLAGVTGNIYAGLHEFYDMAFLLHLLRPGDIFIDAGANVGSFSLLASGVCEAKSITIEPIRSTFDILNNNITLNKLENKVRLLNAAAGAKKGTITFTSDEDTTNHVVIGDEAKEHGTVEVPTITIDSLSVDGMPLLIKIDVEGFETEVLKGMEMTLDSSALKAIIIELNGSGDRYGYDEEKIHELLISKSFQPYAYDPFKRLLVVMKSFGRNVSNTIYCRDEAFIHQRIKDAKYVNIMGELI